MWLTVRRLKCSLILTTATRYATSHARERCTPLNGRIEWTRLVVLSIVSQHKWLISSESFAMPSSKHTLRDGYMTGEMQTHKSLHRSVLMIVCPLMSNYTCCFDFELPFAQLRAILHRAVVYRITGIVVHDFSNAGIELCFFLYYKKLKSS